MFRVGDRVLYVPESKFGVIAGYHGKAGCYNVYNVLLEKDSMATIYAHNLIKVPEEPELTVESAVKFLKDCGFKVTLESL